MIEAIPTMGRRDTLCGEPAELLLSVNCGINEPCECFVLVSGNCTVRALSHSGFDGQLRRRTSGQCHLGFGRHHVLAERRVLGALPAHGRNLNTTLKYYYPCH